MNDEAKIDALRSALITCKDITDSGDIYDTCERALKLTAPECGACPGGGLLCKTACKLEQESPLAFAAATSEQAASAAPVADTGAVRCFYMETGAEYDHLAVAKGAGPLRGSLFHVYRDASGQHYVRTPMDFDARMTTAPVSPAPTADSAADARPKITSALRRAAENTRMDLGPIGTNYPDIRQLLGFVEACIDAMRINTEEGE